MIRTYFNINSLRVFGQAALIGVNALMKLSLHRGKSLGIINGRTRMTAECETQYNDHLLIEG